MTDKELYIPNPIVPQDEEGKSLYLLAELNKIAYWIANEKSRELIGKPGEPPGHVHLHSTLTGVEPDQHHSKAHDFIGTDHVNMPYLMPESPLDGQTYGRKGSDVEWTPTFNKTESDDRYLPLVSADYSGISGQVIYGGRTA
jgi:hypothetical protein